VGHALNIKTVAKSVESKKTSTLLNKIGVNLGQGFALDEPKELEMFTKFTVNSKTG